MNKEKLAILKTTLESYSTEDFTHLIPKSIIGLSKAQQETVQFAFWFSYIVETDLTRVLSEAIANTKNILGETQPEVDKYLREEHNIRYEIIDVDHPKYDPYSITFNNRIDIVEKMRGKDTHTNFFRKIKKLRNDLSHGRILELSYNGKSVFDDDTKREMLHDYISGMINFEERGIGGAFPTQDDETRKKIDNLWSEFEKNNSS